jgi:hypothetical protein
VHLSHLTNVRHGCRSRGLDVSHLRTSWLTVRIVARFMASLRMYSNRTIAARCVNAQGKKNTHEADGVFSLFGPSTEANAEPYTDIFPVYV